MKILQINAVYKYASTGRNMYEMNTYFASKGHECVAAYSKGTANLENGEYLIGTGIDHKIHALLSRLSGLQGYFSGGATKKLLKFIDSFSPDMVVLNNLHSNYIHLPMLLKYLAQKDIATVAVLHDCNFYTGKCCYYSLNNCSRWKDSCGKCKNLRQHNVSWFFDRTQKMLKDKKILFGNLKRLGVVAVSDWILREAKIAPVFEKASVIKRIYNWIDTDVFYPRDSVVMRKELGLHSKKVALCVASFWTPGDMLDNVLQISKGLNEDECIVIVGKFTERVELPQNIIAVGETDSVEELAIYYSMADVFAQVSHEHTFGKVSAEALCCGTPVVCFNSTANPELVGPGCGKVADAHDIDGMLKNIQEIFADGKDAYSVACREYALENFGKGNMQEYLDLFKELVK